MTAVDYPLPVWRSLASGNYNNSDRREALDRGVNISSPTEISYKLFEEKNESTPNAYLFVMFVKLPNWKSNGNFFDITSYFQIILTSKSNRNSWIAK